MSVQLFATFSALRSNPDRRELRDRFLRLALAVLNRSVRGSPDPDESAQRALLRVDRHLGACRATSPGRLVAWLVRVARSVSLVDAWSQRRETLEPVHHPAVEGRSPLDDARGRAFEAVVEAASSLEVRALGGAERVLARRWRVASTPAGVRRDVALALAVRDQGVPVAQLAEHTGLSAATVRQAVGRGVAALRLTARTLPRTGDPFFDEALDEMSRTS